MSRDVAAPVLDAFGFPLPQVPKPVQISKGADPADWTKEQQFNDFSHKLGGKFAAGVPKPPAGPGYYWPSPNDVTEFVDGEWRQKNEYREI